MAYKVLLVDIDGTLVQEGAPGPAQKDLDALLGLQRRGIPVVISTGRSSSHIGTDFLGGLVPNYGIFFNGGFVCKGDLTPIYEERLSTAQTEEILALGARDDCAVGLTFEDGYFIYHGEEHHRQFHREMFGEEAEYAINRDLRRHLKNLPLSAFGRFPKDMVAEFATRDNGLRMVPLNARESGHDIVKAHTNKARGTQKLLAHLGLGFADVVAIGDSKNDVEMLAAAGMGIAMENAAPEAKAAANHITGHVKDNGVAQAVARFFPQ